MRNSSLVLPVSAMRPSLEPVPCCWTFHVHICEMNKSSSVYTFPSLQKQNPCALPPWPTKWPTADWDCFSVHLPRMVKAFWSKPQPSHHATQTPCKHKELILSGLYILEVCISLFPQHNLATIQNRYRLLGSHRAEIRFLNLEDWFSY